MMIGIDRVSGSRLIARVAWKPLRPGITTSIRIRSGFSCFDLWIASSPLSLEKTSKPAFVSMSFNTCRSVGESSTIRIFRMAMMSGFCAVARSSRRRARVRCDRLEQAFLRERLRQILVRSHHPASRAVEKSVLRRQHHDRRVMKSRVLLDERARLVAVESRHHDVDEHEIGLMVGDLRQSVEAVLSQGYRATRLKQKNFRAAANRFCVVDHTYLIGF